jgi:uncharacterized membrane protein YccC
VINERLANAVVAVGVAVWLANFVLNALPINYDPPPEISGVFGLVVGLVITLRRHHSARDDNEREEA